MKYILLSILLWGNVHCQTKLPHLNYSISIWDYDYSMASTIYYYIDNKSLTVESISGIENEKDSVLLKRSITAKEEKLLTNFLSSFKVNNLKSSYVDTLVEDGDRKKIKLIINENSKEIEISNMYNEQLADLFNVINQLVDKSLWITYN